MSEILATVGYVYTNSPPNDNSLREVLVGALARGTVIVLKTLVEQEYWMQLMAKAPLQRTCWLLAASAVSTPFPGNR